MLLYHSLVDSIPPGAGEPGTGDPQLVPPSCLAMVQEKRHGGTSATCERRVPVTPCLFGGQSLPGFGGLASAAESNLVIPRHEDHPHSDMPRETRVWYLRRQVQEGILWGGRRRRGGCGW